MIQKQLAVDGKLPAHALQTEHACPSLRREAGVEIRQARRQPFHLIAREHAAGDAAVEHVGIGQALHLYQPVHHRPTATQFQTSATLPAEWDKTNIGPCGKSPVKPDFLGAEMMPPGARAEVQMRPPDRLLQLVDAGFGEEDPGHVRLTRLDIAHALAIGGGSAQEPNLFGQIVHLSRRTPEGYVQRRVLKNCACAPRSMDLRSPPFDR